MEEFPQAHMIFTPTEKLYNKAQEITCGLGFDLIIDFDSSLQLMKRNVFKLCSPFARIITTSQDLQLDPPETKIL